MKNDSNFYINSFNYNNLDNISFGEQQGEIDSILKNSFIATDSVKRVLTNKINYVISPKGHGKSALFNALQNRYIHSTLFNYNNKIMLFINSAFGVEDNYLNHDKYKLSDSRVDYVFAWAIFILHNILDEITNHYSNKSGYSELESIISKHEYFKDKYELYSILDYLENWNTSLRFNVNGNELILSPRKRKTKNDIIDINNVYKTINSFLLKNNLILNIYIDRIDRFVSNSEYELQKKYIQGLFDSIEEISLSSNIHPVLFLRSDLFYSMDIVYEIDKVRDRIIELEWRQSEILSFIVRRFLSNEYIYSNYYEYLFKLVGDERNGDKSQNGFLYKFLKYFKKSGRYINTNKDLSYRISHKFIITFFPEYIRHKNSKGEYESAEFTEWLFTHFSSYKDNINPRCIIWYFNQLFKLQFNAYSRDPSILDYKEEISPVRDGDKVFLNIFFDNVIEQAYLILQNSELRNIHGLLKSRDHRDVFQRINKLIMQNGRMEYGDINFKNHNLSRDEYDSLLKYLDLLGYLKHNRNEKYYSTPILYQKELEF